MTITCVENIQSLYILQGFSDSVINIQLSAWANREDFLALKNGIIQRVKEAFDENNIEVPFPHRTLYTGIETKPFSIQHIKSL
ncbi:mechanosensitive ion channel family protein [Spartinivicinus marinus]|uniref:mechanosensitive ion channel family protein n=1 Tax=Spartinivicinus marinus TaxID=2994442 RepID=UPI001C5C9834